MRTRPWPARMSRAVLAALAGAALACNLTPAPAPTSPPEPTPQPPPVVSTPVDTPTPPPPPTSTAPPGWLTYRNEMLGYEFDYPAQAQLIAVGVTGYPTDELPAGVEPGQYIATLEASYPEALCAGIEFGTAYLYVGAPESLGGKYSTPCGISGVGASELRSFEEPVVIGGETVTASGDRGYSLTVGTFLFEILFVGWREFRFNYGGDWDSPGVTLEDYLVDKAVIEQVLASWRWLE
jgi:hypothetical protein